jgi:predicted nucleic acid-binding protein
LIFLLDSNIIIDVLRGRNNRSRDLFHLLSVHKAEAASTSIVIAEVYMGARPKEIPVIDRLFSTLLYVPVTASSAKLAGSLFAYWRTRGKTLSTPDLMIAAVCIENDCTLITDNVNHFPMPELKVQLLP